MARPGTRGVSTGRILSWAPLVGLILVAAYFRLANLGELGARWDEDLTSLAVRAILETGIPELPSGMIYLRGGVFLYLMAASAKLLGFSEFALRLPAALFGIGLVPLAYLFARRLFDKNVGLLTAAMITLSAWDIELSQYARMYMPFTCFYLLTIICIWRYRVCEQNTMGGGLCVLLALISISLHQLGYTLALAFLIPLLVEPEGVVRDPKRLLFPVAACLAVGIAFLAWREFLTYFMNIPLYLSDGVPAATGQQVEQGGSVLSHAIQFIAAQVQVPELLYGAVLWDRAPLLLILLAAAVSAAAFYIARQHRGVVSRGERLLIMAIAATCVLQQFNLALIGTLVLVFLKKNGIVGFGRRDVRLTLGLVALSFSAWVVLGLAFDLGGHAQDGALVALRRTVKGLLDYPRFAVFWGFVKERPLMSIPAAIGGLWAFHRAAQPSRDPAACFLILVFMLPLIVNGLFQYPYELFRYNVPFDTFYFAFVALGLVGWRELAGVWPGVSVSIEGVRSAWGTALLLALVLLIDLNPLRSWLITQRGHHNEGWLYQVFGMERYPDFATPAAYVKTQARPEDVVLVLDLREIYAYLGRADYWVRSAVYELQTYRDGDVLRDKYVATPLITDLEVLERTLNGRPGIRKWLIASDRMMARTSALSAEIKDFIRGQGRRVVYVGLDGSTKVYLFD